MTRTTISTTKRTFLVSLGLVFLSSLVLATNHDGRSSHLGARTPKRSQARREYDTHAYYVLEVSPSYRAEELEEIVRTLGAEAVEQVGELKDHYLIRAQHHFVEQGEPEWRPVRAVQQDQKEWPVREVGLSQRLARRAVEERDTVLERFDLLERTRASHSIKKRSSHHHIRSLERQHLRLRNKRDLPTLPPSRYSSRVKRQLIDLIERQTETGSGSMTGLISQMAKKFSILDPLWSKQWHLTNEMMPENSINVTGVWEQGVTGKGINVAIVDDGLDMHSDDLAANFHAEGSWDYNDHTALPEPRLDDDQHGTRCAGEIAAVKNDVCGVGVAHNAGIAGIRILSALISDADEAASLNYGYQTNDIYSCSWGPPDDGKAMDAPANLITKAMLNGVQNGRGGKGSVFVFASGNGGGVDDQCNFDGYTNSLMSITVGAIDRKGLHPFYSEACAAVMVVTYSSGSGDNIHTTDVGKNKCTDRHGGTSAAAPIAAGIFALALEVRPELTWRDMQHLCVRTAIQVNPEDPDWQMTASGRYYNHKYGFGKLDAYRIVEAARTIPLVKPQAWWASPSVEAGIPVSAEGKLSSLVITKNDVTKANLEKLEHVTITVHIEHTKRGNIEVELISPKGMKSILARPRRFDDSTAGMPGWVLMTVKHWDEDPVGTWTLLVRDRQKDNHNGTFHSWSMRLWGSAIDPTIAEPYRLPGEHHYDGQPPEEGDEPLSTTPALPVPTNPAELEPTKAFPKPTEHLPDDHAQATGEAHVTFGEYETSVPTPTSLPPFTDDDDVDDDDDGIGNKLETKPADTTGSGSNEWTSGDTIYDETPGYLAGMSRLVGSTTWLFVAVGTIVVFISGVSAFFLLRRRGARRGIGRGVYDFAPTADDDDVPMSSMERGGIKLGRNGSGDSGGARTKELFNAFALDSDEEAEEGDSEDEANEERKRIMGSQRYTDDLDEDDMRSKEAIAEREAREHFSD